MARQRWKLPPSLTADEAVRLIAPGDRVYLHEVAMTPHELIDALVRRASERTGVETVSLHTEGPAPYVAPELAGRLRHNALFVGANVREAVNDGRADYTPVFLIKRAQPLHERGRALAKQRSVVAPLQEAAESHTDHREGERRRCDVEHTQKAEAETARGQPQTK